MADAYNLVICRHVTYFVRSARDPQTLFILCVCTMNVYMTYASDKFVNGLMKLLRYGALLLLIYLGLSSN